MENNTVGSNYLVAVAPALYKPISVSKNRVLQQRSTVGPPSSWSDVSFVINSFCHNERRTMKVVVTLIIPEPFRIAVDRQSLSSWLLPRRGNLMLSFLDSLNIYPYEM